MIRCLTTLDRAVLGHGAGIPERLRPHHFRTASERAELLNEAERIRDRMAEIRNDIDALDRTLGSLGYIGNLDAAMPPPEASGHVRVRRADARSEAAYELAIRSRFQRLRAAKRRPCESRGMRSGSGRHRTRMAI